MGACASNSELSLRGSAKQGVYWRARPAAHDLRAVPPFFRPSLPSISQHGHLVVGYHECVSFVDARILLSTAMRGMTGQCVCVCVCVCVLSMWLFISISINDDIG